jgi:hypothetical protein
LRTVSDAMQRETLSVVLATARREAVIRKVFPDEE